MKKNILVVIALLVATISFATEAPKAVQQAFAKKFPTAKSVKWEKENAKEYEASFTLDGAKCSANFNIEGTWLETETEIKITDLPTAVSTAIKTKYANWEIEAASKIETSSSEVKYEADIKKEKTKKEVLLKADGTFIE